ncbi:phosphonate ABC transporter substrate-binding protein [Dissulfurispira thermophila]|uniref:Phosphonate ABC transporter substrate-binding protein n=1 Tax=Dissulfurispira thermophila TaxID=2715679 RepID=A0A7G1H1Q8_9BACT|nr:phosphonate ABC transporter substrate-binding protein [Dissulfurispira thermophila]
MDIKKVEPPRIREKTLTIAILPEQNVFEQKKRYKPLAAYLSERLDTNVKIKLLDSYGSIYDEIKNKTIDGAFFGSFNYVLTKARADIEPVARPVEMGEKSNYRGIIFTRKDSGLTEDVRTWKGKRIALVHEVTTAGYIFPRWYLKKYGIKSFEHHFRKIIFTGSHDAAILSVFKGQADIGAAKDLIFEKLLSENPALKKEIVILARSIEVPSNSLCVRGDLNTNIKDLLKKSLLSMHNTPEGKNALKALNAVRFKETIDSEFNVLREMARDLDIDTRAYPFRYRR